MPERKEIAIAPMMDRTDRHCRFFYRLLAPDVLLYTEMVVAQAVINGDRSRLLDFDREEHPLALQLGGSDPQQLAEACSIAADWGYDEINLNIGCPSDRVQSGQFGACLMAEPDRVAECVHAMRNKVDVPVTVKTRIGIDDHEDYGFLAEFIKTVAAAGCAKFIVHARKAILEGLSPKENRSIPPLRYEVVYRVKQDFPELRIILNGGVRATQEVRAHLEHVDGVMIGRQAYSDPYWLTELQQLVGSGPSGSDSSAWQPPERDKILAQMTEYAERSVHGHTRMHHITRHMLGLYAGQPGARAWRRFISEAVVAGKVSPNLLLASVTQSQ